MTPQTATDTITDTITDTATGRAIREITGDGIDHLIDADGYQVLTLRGMIHAITVMPDGLGDGLLVEVDNGVQTATGRLDQEHIDALHAFLGQFATPVDTPDETGRTD